MSTEPRSVKAELWPLLQGAHSEIPGPPLFPLVELQIEVYQCVGRVVAELEVG